MTLRQIISAKLPRSLSTDSRLTPTDIAVYMYLSHQSAKSLHRHAKQCGMAYETFRRSAHRLVKLDWVFTRPAGRWPVFIPAMPLETEQEVAEELKRQRSDIAFLGEWLMKCVLDLLVDDEDFTDNARPPWLVSGDGSGRFELDRWYRTARMALEFQGPQHFRTGGPYSVTEDDLNRQVERDRIKAGICNTEGIRLIHVTAKELGCATITEKIKGLVPLATVREERPIYRELEKMCRAYVNFASRAQK